MCCFTLKHQNLIFVTINYRLHALGFLSFRNDLVSGNLDMRLREQQLAIRWVRENIELTYTSIHGDDLTFILDQSSLSVEFSEEERKKGRHMVKYWSNFVKSGIHLVPGNSDQQGESDRENL